MLSSSLWPDGSEKMYKCPAAEPGCGWLAIKNNKYQVQPQPGWCMIMILSCTVMYTSWFKVIIYFGQICYSRYTNQHKDFTKCGDKPIEIN